MTSSLRAFGVLEGTETEVVINLYADTVFVLATQLGKVGNLIQATIPSVSYSRTITEDTTSSGELGLPEPPSSIELTPLLGSPQSDYLATLHSLYASQIATIVWNNTEGGSSLRDGLPSRRVVVGVALKRGQDDLGESGGVLSESARKTYLGVMALVSNLLKAAE